MLEAKDKQLEAKDKAKDEQFKAMLEAKDKAKDKQLDELLNAKDEQFKAMLEAKDRQLEAKDKAKDKQLDELLKAKDEQLVAMLEAKDRQLEAQLKTQADMYKERKEEYAEMMKRHQDALDATVAEAMRTMPSRTPSYLSTSRSPQSKNGSVSPNMAQVNSGTPASVQNSTQKKNSKSVFAKSTGGDTVPAPVAKQKAKSSKTKKATQQMARTMDAAGPSTSASVVGGP